MDGRAWLAVACGGLVVGCVGVRSTGAVLPQSSEEFGQESLRVTVDHDCSDGRCKSFKATFENLVDEPIDINVGASRMSRAGASLALSVQGNPKQSVITVPARDSVSATFVPVNANGRPMTYVRNKAVYCSLKVDSACRKPNDGEARCAGFARYYYQSHVSTGGWLTLSFVAKGRSWIRAESFVSPAPQFMGTPPAVELTSDTDAPWWGSSGGDVVFHKIECDAKCRCRDVVRPRSFHVDDRFEPAER